MTALSPAEHDGLPPIGGEEALLAEAYDFMLFCTDPGGYGAIDTRRPSAGLLEFLADMDQVGDARYKGWDRAFTHSRIVANALLLRIERRYLRTKTGMLTVRFDPELPEGEAVHAQALIDAVALSRVGKVPHGGAGVPLGDDIRDAYGATLRELGAEPGNGLRLPGADFQTVVRSVLSGEVQVGSPKYEYKLSDLAPK